MLKAFECNAGRWTVTARYIHMKGGFTTLMGILLFLD